MQCVVLAGGLGTRIRSVAPDVPKALIPVAGQPFAHHQLLWLGEQGVTDALYCIGHQGSVIRDALRDAPGGVALAFSDEGEALRGTGGAIRLALDRGLLAAKFLVLYADSYLPIEIAPAWQAATQGDEPTMVVMRNEGRWDTSNVVFQDGWVRRYEKNLADPAAAGMNFIDYGLGILNRSVVANRIPADTPFDLATLYGGLARDGLLRGHEVHQRFYEIGSPRGLAELDAFLSKQLLDRWSTS